MTPFAAARPAAGRIDELLARCVPFAVTGRLTQISGLAASVADFPAPLGALCRIERDAGAPLAAEVVGFRDDETVLLAEGEFAGVRRGSRVHLVRSQPALRVGPELLGRVVDGAGRVVDGKGTLRLRDWADLYAAAPPALDRPRIAAPLATGVRVIDGLLTCGVGQRLGIFAGSGVGKSTLLGQIARRSAADVNVVVLIGERGREVREFLEDNLGPEGLARSVVVVATGDEPALVRRRAALVGAAIAEYFRDTGADVLLLVDSITRLAAAQREIGLASGEPPTVRGYPPSVFALLPKVFERSGRAAHGSITGLYTVLVDGDDFNEPIADAVRGTLDGHVVLSRKLAHAGRFPAVDVLASVSRVMPEVVPPEHLQAAARIRRVLAAYHQAEDLISIGAYVSGTQRDVDTAIERSAELREFLCQERDETTLWSTMEGRLRRLAESCDV